MPDETEPPPRKFALKPKDFERVNAPPEQAGATPETNDVFALRRQLREREQAAGMDALAEKPRWKSRRKRDFVAALAIGWSGLVGIGALAGGGVGLLAGALLGVFFTVGLWWVVFNVLDDY